MAAWQIPAAPPVAPAGTRPVPLSREPIRPLTLDQNLNPGKVKLGRKLFHEPKLSANNTVSCASCHDLKKGGTDQRARSIGIRSREGAINAPTVFNSSLNFRQFWDGRAANLEEQVSGPIHNPVEMGSSWDEVVTKLSQTPPYPAEFRALYKDGIRPDNIADAISEFERSLVTTNSRFDRYLLGNASILTEVEKRGYQKFKSFGCTACHQGANVGGNMYEPLGAMTDYFLKRGNITEADYGRYNITGREEDKFVFKVPSLRNVVLTAPYFHDGSARTLDEAVATMGQYQLGLSLSPEDISDIVQFLGTLTGEYPEGN